MHGLQRMASPNSFFISDSRAWSSVSSQNVHSFNFFKHRESFNVIIQKKNYHNAEFIWLPPSCVTARLQAEKNNQYLEENNSKNERQRKIVE